MTTGKFAAWGLPMRIAALELRVTRIVSRPRQSVKELRIWSSRHLIIWSLIVSMNDQMTK